MSSSPDEVGDRPERDGDPRESTPSAPEPTTAGTQELSDSALAARRYQLLFENHPQAMWVCDTGTLKFLAVNNTALRRYGYSRAEFLALTLEDIRPKEDIPYLAPMLSYGHESVRTYDNVRHKKKDGTIFYVQISSSPLPAYGRNARLVIATDVSEHRKTEEEHLRLATAVEQSAESIMISDASGTLLYVNPAFEKTSGYTRQEVIGNNVRMFQSGEHDASFYEGMWDTIAQGNVWFGQVINRRKDGALIHEEMTISPLRDDRGAIVNYVAVKRDVTRELALEEQLRQAQRMELIGQLAGGIAHDFNNILTIIRANAALLMEERGMPETQRSLVRDIAEASERAERLTRQLLVSSRRQQLEVREIDLNGVLRSMAEMLERVLGRALRLRFDFAQELPLIRADQGMLEQVLLNLVLNARDSMERGGQLTIATSERVLAENPDNPEAAGGRYVCLAVQDTGCGIPSEHLARVFEPFFTTKEVGKGTGLGLATAYAIIKQHHGWIETESQVDIGTTFRVHLPVASGRAPQSGSEAFARGLPCGTEGILCAEDEPALRQLLGRLLRRCGYKAWLAASGQEAISLWREHRKEIQLLITDIMMPGGMLGTELARLLKAEDPKLKVIYTSGYGRDVAASSLVLVEGVNMIRKPWLPSAFAQTVRSCLDRK